jgi:tetratricopeptide (TPR) repeat protein
MDRNVNATHDKGAALLAMGKLEDAEKCFDKVLQLDSNHVLGLYNKANLLFDLEKYSEALKYYKKNS